MQVVDHDELANKPPDRIDCIDCIYRIIRHRQALKNDHLPQTMFRCLKACPAVARIALAAALLAGRDSARAADLSLLPPTLSYAGVPGEFRESRMSARTILTLQPGLSWTTATGLTGTRYSQGMPMRSDTLDLSTGPLVRLGRAELELPLTAGRELNNLYGYTSWSGGASNLSVVLGPNDRVRLEAKLSSRSDLTSTRMRRSTNLSWRHAFTERWAVRAGLRQIHESEHGGEEGLLQTESYASLNASLPGGWGWSLQGKLGDSAGGTAALPTSERSTELSLTGRRQLSDRWWLSGTLSSIQVLRSGAGLPASSQSGGVKLQRDF